MAFSITSHVDTLASGSGPYVSDAFTPTGNTLLLAAFIISGTFNTGITGHQGTGDKVWVELTDFDIVGDGIGLELWACITEASPSSGTISVTHDDNAYRVGMMIFEIEGRDVSGTVLNAFGVNDVQNVKYYGAGPHTMSLDAGTFDDAGSASLVVGTSVNTVAPTIDDFASLTTTAWLNSNAVVGSKDAADPTCDVGIIDDPGYDRLMFGLVEVKAAAGAGLSVPEIITMRRNTNNPIINM